MSTMKLRSAVIAASGFAVLLALSTLPAAAQTRGEPPQGRVQAVQTPTHSAQQGNPSPQTGEAPGAPSQQATDTVDPAVASAVVKLAGWRYRAAREQLEAVKGKATENVGYRTAMAVLLAEEGKLDEAISKLEAAAAADAKDPAPELYLGEVAFWKKDYTKAQTAWKVALERAKAYIQAHPDCPHGHYYQGLAQIRMKRYDDAMSSLDAARSHGADPILVDLGQGMAATFGGKWDAAKQALTRVIEADPAVAYAYYYRGLAWNKTGKMDRMVADLEQFVALAPDAPDTGQARALLSAAGG